MQEIQPYTVPMDFILALDELLHVQIYKYLCILHFVIVTKIAKVMVSAAMVLNTLHVEHILFRVVKIV